MQIRWAQAQDGSGLKIKMEWRDFKMPKQYKSIAQMVTAPALPKQVKAALEGTKIPVGPKGTLRLMLFNGDTPMGEIQAVPHSTRFDPDYLVTWAKWYLPDSYGEPTLVEGAYHYCLKAFRCPLPNMLQDVLTQGAPTSDKTATVKYYAEKDREKVYRAFKKYHEIEPWVTTQRDTPLIQALLTKKGALERTFSSSSFDRDLQALAI